MILKKNIQAIFITGPTSGGKSLLAMNLADKINGFIVNADSMQVYKDMKIITNQPTNDDLLSCPHALYGFVPMSIPFSVGKWYNEICKLLKYIWNINKIPIIVGGTGLYFKIMIGGLNSIPEINPIIKFYCNNIKKNTVLIL